MTWMRFLAILLISHCSCEVYPSRLLLSKVSVRHNVSSSSLHWDISTIHRINTTSPPLCEMHMTGTIVLPIEHEVFFKTGHAAMALEGYPDTTTCLYMTVTGAEVNHQHDIPNTLNIAVMCSIQASDVNTVTNPCSTLLYDRVPISITVHPARTLEPEEAGPPPPNFVSGRPYKPQNIHYLSPPPPPSLPLPLTASITSSPYSPSEMVGQRVVCTVQTFRNRMSGPMLYMFLQYYLSTGWGVVIFDRFGRHADVVQEFLSSSGLVYYPFTILQNLFPDIYNSEFERTQGSEFKFYSRRGAHGFPEGENNILQGNAEANDDADRRKSYNYARLVFSDALSILYADRDEFFYCNTKVNSLAVQKAIHTRYITKVARREKHGIVLKRMAHAPVYPRSYRPPTTDASPPRMFDVNEHVTSCLEAGYLVRNMSALWGCWSGIYMVNTKSKSLDVNTGWRCPFYGVHNVCLRCQCQLEESNRCYIIHLNSVYFKPRMLNKYGDDIYTSHTAMTSIWNR